MAAYNKERLKHLLKYEEQAIIKIRNGEIIK
jgi:hypothetical protein